MENKKSLLNQKIKKEEIQKFAKIITKKALKVISCSGSIYALKLLENRDVDTLEDLYQEVSLQIVLDGYIITRNAYKVVRKYIYNNYEKNNIELFFENENENIIDDTINKNCYISYINNSNEENQKKATRIDLKKLYNLLSENEKRIFFYYYNNNMKQIKIAEMLEVKRGAVNVYVDRIKNKANKCLVSEV